MKTKKAEPPFVNFYVAREHLDRDGNWNPRPIPPPLNAAFQISVFGSRDHYLQLAEFFRKFAERDTSDDSEYHEHIDGLMSIIGNVRLDVILRKDDVGDSIWHDLFPKPIKKKRKAKTK